jgi:hypothetical protein
LSSEALVEFAAVAQWVKPFGTTDPPVCLEDDWIDARQVDLDRWEILSGPDQRNPPAIGTGDHLIFHAVGHARLFGAGEVLSAPRWKRDDFWGTRFPWIYPIRVDIWLPTISQGPRVSDALPSRVLGRLQAGAPYAPLTPEQHQALMSELLGISSVQVRDDIP